MMSILLGKEIEARQLEKELKDQDRKFFRAQNVVKELGQELKDLVPNPEAFEHDMDLREEKEKQRSALIRLRELSQADEEFSERVQSYLAKVGLVIPPISRLEARATSSRTGTGSGGYGTTSTRGYISTTSASSRGGGYRGASESHVMFETVGTGANNGSGNRRTKTALPVN